MGKLLVILISLPVSLVATASVTDNLGGFLEYGVLGLSVLALGTALIKKDKQVNSLYSQLVEKAEKDTEKYHELAEELNNTMNALIEIVEEKKWIGFLVW